MEHPCIPGGCSRNIQHTAGSPCAWQGESLIVSGLTALSSALDTNTSLQLLGTAQGTAQAQGRAVTALSAGKCPPQPCLAALDAPHH